MTRRMGSPVFSAASGRRRTNMVQKTYARPARGPGSRLRLMPRRAPRRPRSGTCGRRAHTFSPAAPANCFLPRRGRPQMRIKIDSPRVRVRSQKAGANPPATPRWSRKTPMLRHPGGLSPRRNRGLLLITTLGGYAEWHSCAKSHICSKPMQIRRRRLTD